jgi:hypothetical protein
MGQGLIKQEDLAAFLLANNAAIKPDFVKDLAGYYIKEAVAEGVNHDVAFSQMCLETGYLRFGNLVTPDMNNFCGLGSIGPGQPGERFPNPQTGVRAHIQHLKGYATEEPLRQELVDPRYKWVKKGSAPDIHGLTGKWAADPNYDGKISGILVRLYDMAAGAGHGKISGYHSFRFEKGSRRNLLFHSETTSSSACTKAAFFKPGILKKPQMKK